MYKLPVFLLFIFASVLNSNASRILGIFPMPSVSHYTVGSALMKGLMEAGHDVTLISPFKGKPTIKGKWREIELEGFYEKMTKEFNEKQNVFDMESRSVWMSLAFIHMVVNDHTENTLRNHKIQDLLKSREKFDVVIISHFLNDAVFSLAKQFGGHLILLSTFDSGSWNNDLFGNPSLPSFYPEIELGYPPKMNFIQRVTNTICKTILYIVSNAELYFIQNSLVKKYVSESEDVYSARNNVSLILLNSHVSVTSPKPHVPNMIEIGGVHVQPPQKLPSDLQLLLDNAKEGVIYLSFGSIVKCKNLPDSKREAILKAFSKRKETILWKWENDTLPGQPPNVHLSKWFPQNDILAHPNVKVFITHSGLLSIMETVYHGVPIIAIPVFGDQRNNAQLAKDRGYGVILSFKELTEEKLSHNLDEILSNPKYRENVKEYSKMLKDRVVKPLDEAVYWVEYVIRHNGAKHLKVPYLHLMWYQYYSLDVFAFIFGLVALAVVIIRKLLKYVCFLTRKKDKLKKN